MKEKQKTREEMIAEVARLSSANQSIIAVDADKALQLSKILGAPKNDYNASQVQPYSWAQIFAEVGKLIGRLEIANVDRAVRDLNHRISIIESLLQEETHHDNELPH